VQLYNMLAEKLKRLLQLLIIIYKILIVSVVYNNNLYRVGTRGVHLKTKIIIYREVFYTNIVTQSKNTKHSYDMGRYRNLKRPPTPYYIKISIIKLLYKLKRY